MTPGLPSIGAVIDDTYEIKSLLGKGGFGAVFLARHIPMEREVALKMLLAQGHNPGEMVQRFRREVMAIRNLSHPNTVRIFDYRDSTEDTLIYYTMEYLRGGTLKDVIKKDGAQPPRRVKPILKQVLKSLAEAHSHGIVHRDLKPANIMLVEMYGEQDFVKVLDFGIAKIMEQEEDEDEPLTSAGMLVGTLRYMSPEQIKGLPLGPYTDLYALGLIIMEMLMGQSVFAGTGRWEILQKQVSPEPIHFPEEIHQSALMPVLERMLHKGVQGRYPNAEAALRDLQSIPDEALSPSPLFTSRASTPPQLDPSFNSANSASHLSAPSTPVPLPLDQAPTTISQSDLSLMPQRVHASTFGAAEAAPRGGRGEPGGLAPPPPLPLAAASPPLASTTDSVRLVAAADSFEAPKRAALTAAKISSPSNTLKFALIGALALAVLMGGGVAAWMAIKTQDAPSPTQPEALDEPVSAALLLKPDEDKKPEVIEQEPLEPKDEAPMEDTTRRITIKLKSALQDVSAQAYLGDELLGTLPLEYELEQGASRTLTIQAERFESAEIVLTPRSELELSVSLEPDSSNSDEPKVEEKKLKTRPSPPSPSPRRAPKRADEQEEEDDDAFWTPKPKKKPKVSAFE